MTLALPLIGYRMALFAWRLRRLGLPWRDCVALAVDAERLR